MTLPAGAPVEPALPFGERWRIARDRALRWEFWPAWLWYLPVIAWILLLGLRHRRPTAFSAANPGIDCSGVVGERKSEILAPLVATRPAFVAPYLLLRHAQPLDARLVQARAFVAAGSGYPVVLKPDIGCRGRGVAVIRDDAALSRWLARAPGDALLQRYVGGAEFGVFVSRDPATGAARVWSVTSKRFPAVVGDGARPLSALILADPRARLIAPLLWRMHAPRLAWVVPAGERFALVEIGAHCRGSLFLDASHLIAPGLQEFVEQVFEALPGFWFGRLDLRCPDDAALSAGRGIQLLEVNGVTGEDAHAYHPGTPLLRGYRVAFRQWRLSFGIGAWHAARGVPTTSPLELLRRFREDLAVAENWEAAFR